jgi:hypothetical protein
MAFGFNRLLKNAFEAADARQKQAKERSLCLINEHFEPVFNTAAATQIVFQRPVNVGCNKRSALHRMCFIRRNIDCALLIYPARISA